MALVLVQQPEDVGFALRPGNVRSVEDRPDLAVEAANCSVEISPHDAFLRGLIARAAWMAGQPNLLRIETKRAIELNPNDPQNLRPLGNLLAYMGFWDEGVPLDEKAIALIAPRRPWWLWAGSESAFAREDYAGAFAVFRQSYLQTASTFIPRQYERGQDACLDIAENTARMFHTRSRRLLQDLLDFLIVPADDG